MLASDELVEAPMLVDVWLAYQEPFEEPKLFAAWPPQKEAVGELVLYAVWLHWLAHEDLVMMLVHRPEVSCCFSLPVWRVVLMMRMQLWQCVLLSAAYEACLMSDVVD